MPVVAAVSDVVELAATSTHQTCHLEFGPTSSACLLSEQPNSSICAMQTTLFVVRVNINRTRVTSTNGSVSSIVRFVDDEGGDDSRIG